MNHFFGFIRSYFCSRSELLFSAQFSGASLSTSSNMVFSDPTLWMKVHAFWIRFDLLCPFPSKQAEFAHPRFMFLRLVFIAPYLSCSQDRVTLASPFLFGSFFSAFVMVVSLTMTTMMRSRFILSELSERLFARFESTKSQNQTQRIFFVFPVRNTL